MYITSTFAMIIHGNFWGPFFSWRFTISPPRSTSWRSMGFGALRPEGQLSAMHRVFPRCQRGPDREVVGKFCLGKLPKKKWLLRFFWDVVVVVEPPPMFFWWNPGNHWRKIYNFRVYRIKTFCRSCTWQICNERIPAREPAAHRLSSWSLVVTGIALEGVAAWVSPTKPVDLTAKCPWWWRTMIRSPHADIGRLTRALPKHIREMCGCNLVSLSVCSSVISGSHSMSVM